MSKLVKILGGLLIGGIVAFTSITNVHATAPTKTELLDKIKYNCSFYIDEDKYLEALELINVNYTGDDIEESTTVVTSSLQTNTSRRNLYD